MRKILTVLVLGLALVGSCFAYSYIDDFEFSTHLQDVAFTNDLDKDFNDIVEDYFGFGSFSIESETQFNQVENSGDVSALVKTMKANDFKYAVFYGQPDWRYCVGIIYLKNNKIFYKEIYCYRNLKVF